MPEPLTIRQREVLHFIVTFYGENLSPPSVRDIMERFGLASPYGCHRHIRKLQAKGYLRASGGRVVIIAIEQTVAAVAEDYAREVKALPAMTMPEAVRHTHRQRKVRE